MNYVTGSHAFKAGTTFNWGTNSATYSPNGQIYSLNFLRGQPYYVVVRNTPFTAINEMKADLGIYGQDAWTLGRLTLNLGGRYDYFHAAVPAQHEGPGPWVPFDRDFPGVDNVPKWRDWALRMAGAYDLFGNGKTGLKVAANRYLESMAAGFASEFNPMTPKFDVRGWFDVDGNKSILDANGNIQFNTGAIAGRPISGGVGDTSNQIVVNLIEPNTLFLDCQHRVDTRVARNFRAGSSQIQGFVDLFNLFNAGTVTAVNQTYNTTTNVWMRPTTIMTGRTLRFGAQMTF